MDVNWTLLLPREAESVVKARRMLRDTATLVGMDPEVSFDLGVALTEACANVIEHAGRAEGYWVAAGISSDRCWVDVVDNGIGFAPHRLAEHSGLRGCRPVPAAVPVADTPEGGRGLILIEALCDRVDIRNHPARGAMIHFERDLKPREQMAA
ncbi:MAG TPA: ATP-binding protein [Actinocrinis sp.]|nr:ATP-binding protein [Actinocrinis sp.]